MFARPSDRAFFSFYMSEPTINSCTTPTTADDSTTAQRAPGKLKTDCAAAPLQFKHISLFLYLLEGLFLNV